MIPPPGLEVCSTSGWCMGKNGRPVFLSTSHTAGWEKNWPAILPHAPNVSTTSCGTHFRPSSEQMGSLHVCFITGVLTLAEWGFDLFCRVHLSIRLKKGHALETLITPHQADILIAGWDRGNWPNQIHVKPAIYFCHQCIWSGLADGKVGVPA